MDEVEKVDNQISLENQELVEQMVKQMKKLNGRYEVSIPWKINKEDLKCNQQMAERRFASLERRFHRDEVLKNDL